MTIRVIPGPIILSCQNKCECPSSSVTYTKDILQFKKQDFEYQLRWYKWYMVYGLWFPTPYQSFTSFLIGLFRSISGYINQLGFFLVLFLTYYSVVECQTKSLSNPCVPSAMFPIFLDNYTCCLKKERSSKKTKLQLNNIKLKLLLFQI